LKAKPFGFKFRRQHPYSVYIFDFYCHSIKLVIEVDGSIHDVLEIKQNDELRQRLVEKDGIMVIRFSNEKVVNKFEEVIDELNKYLVNQK
jgi:cyclase